MNAHLSGLKPSQRDILRIAGAVIFAAGVLVLLFRKGEDWSDFPLLLVVGIPCAVLYGLGIGALRIGTDEDAGREHADRHALPAWRATALVLGILFVLLTVTQLIETIGGDTDKSGWVFVVFLVTAAAAAYAAAEHGLRYGALLAGLALIVSWVALWDALVEPSTTTIRWLFLLIGAALAFAAWRLHGQDRREAPELVTAAGVAGLAAGITALVALAGVLVGNAISSAFGTEPDVGSSKQGDEWNVFLLVLAVALIWYGARAPWRGPAYVGAVALLVFILSVGEDIGARVEGDDPGTDVVGWPLLLLLLGGAALAAGLLGGNGRDRTTPTPDTATQPVAGGPDAPTQPTPPPGPPPP